MIRCINPRSIASYKYPRSLANAGLDGAYRKTNGVWTRMSPMKDYIVGKQEQKKQNIELFVHNGFMDFIPYTYKEEGEIFVEHSIDGPRIYRFDNGRVTEIEFDGEKFIRIGKKQANRYDKTNLREQIISILKNHSKTESFFHMSDNGFIDSEITQYFLSISGDPKINRKIVFSAFDGNIQFESIPIYQAMILSIYPGKLIYHSQETFGLDKNISLSCGDGITSAVFSLVTDRGIIDRRFGAIPLNIVINVSRLGKVKSRITI